MRKSYVLLIAGAERGSRQARMLSTGHCTEVSWAWAWYSWQKDSSGALMNAVWCGSFRVGLAIVCCVALPGLLLGPVSDDCTENARAFPAEIIIHSAVLQPWRLLEWDDGQTQFCFCIISVLKVLFLRTSCRSTTGQWRANGLLPALVRQSEPLLAYILYTHNHRHV